MIKSNPAPDEALHEKYGQAGAYIDCFTTVVSGRVSHSQFVEAFYTSRVFKLERLILKWLVDKPSTDAEAKELAAGTRDRFAAWTVEERSTDQLLMCDYLGQTRSWLMVAACERDGLTRDSTALWFCRHVGAAISVQRAARLSPVVFANPAEFCQGSPREAQQANLTTAGLGRIAFLRFLLRLFLATLAAFEQHFADFVESRLVAAALDRGDVGCGQRHFELRDRQG